jgi:hypothetical protein
MSVDSLFHRAVAEEDDGNDTGDPAESCESHHGDGHVVKLVADKTDDIGAGLTSQIADGIDHGDTRSGGTA